MSFMDWLWPQRLSMQDPWQQAHDLLDEHSLDLGITDRVFDRIVKAVEDGYYFSSAETFRKFAAGQVDSVEMQRFATAAEAFGGPLRRRLTINRQPA